MRNLKVIMAYRGTNYHGYQIQPNAITVQQVVQEGLSKVLNEPITMIGCSRTDTGVHANGYVFNVHTNSSITTKGFLRGMNGLLPSDISLLECEEVSEEFHSRFDCKYKEYVYLIHNSESKNPFAEDLQLHYRRPMNIDLMLEASKHYIGTHDFRSFSAVKDDNIDTIRTIYDFNIETYGNLVKILVKGDGFLYNMVRILVGTLLDVNEGYILPEQIPDIIGSKNRLKAGRTAMAHGLYLNRVYY
ncbi:MAG: tRNA pseudouridine(38-40) synthase TruA [Oscillospiraceae bacterium]